MEQSRNHDVIVVGGGHAGVEAALAASRRGARVALFSLRPDDIGQMSCNPSIGGVGKGHIVREVDALGGAMGTCADQAAIHRRMLNASKGSAVRGPRMQEDRTLFRRAVQSTVEGSGVTIVAAGVDELLLSGGSAIGVRADGRDWSASTIVITTGTFLGSTIFRGTERNVGGRLGGDRPEMLSRQVRELGLASAKLKTGTPPRLDGRTIDWSRLQRQPSDDFPWFMSIDGCAGTTQINCYITRTSAETHDAIRSGLDGSPLLGGDIEGRGPRYCPSIEDKIFRFADKESHQIFLEPEGLDTHLVYPNGLSTSLSAETQLKFLRTIEGLECVEMPTPGYAVEYEHIDPRRLDHRLAHRDIKGLFFAGQVNGTTGYEEAAGQGLVAGANAAAEALGKEPLILDRDDSYVGVMIDDLILQGVSEPYRMLTARAEHRLYLRADNAWARLYDKAVSADLLAEDRKVKIETHLDAKEKAERIISSPKFHPVIDGAPADIAKQPDQRHRLTSLVGAEAPALEAIEDAYYAPYVNRAREDQQRIDSASETRIPDELAYASILGMSNEMIERLEAARPETLGQASRIRGITPGAISTLFFHLKARS